MFGAPLAGTTRAGHQGIDCAALRSILPSNFCCGGGRWLPGIVVVALGEPAAPAVSCAVPRRSAQRRQEGQASGRASLLSWATSQHLLPPISLVLNIAPTNGALMKPRRVKFTHLSWLMLAE